MMPLVLCWIALALALGLLTYCRQRGWLNLEVQRFKDQTVFKVGKYIILIADPSGAYDPGWMRMWKGILICDVPPGTAGYMYRILHSVAYQSWSYDPTGETRFIER